jgi:membrane peptidoglycan carboxypeptidase
MRNRDHSVLSDAMSLIVCGLLAGLVVAAAAFPAIAMSGLLAKAGADTFDSLPTELTLPQSPQVTYVYAADRKTLITTLYDENRRDVPLAEVAPVMQHAMVAAEDTRFYEHNGVDIKGVARAFVANQQAGATSQGASTLTMQYVRQAIAYSPNATPQQVVDATIDSPTRKLREMKLAIALEKKLNKQQILERYLNIAPFGHGAYGVYAAAQVYFGKEPKDLTLGEATLIAGLVKAPSTFDPTTKDGFKQSMDRRNNYVLENMVKLHYATQAEVDAAKKVVPKIIGKPTPNGCTSVLHNDWGFFCDYLQRWWLQQQAFGADPYERENRLKSGGYTIYTSLDVTAQAAAHKHIEQKMPTGSWRALMLAGVQPGTGHIELMATNRRFSNDQSHNGRRTDGQKGAKSNYPNTTNPLISGGGAITGYQAGSTFKMFTLVAALEKGYPLDYTINTVSPYKSSYIIEDNSPAACPHTHFYCPGNANPEWMNGPRNMWTGFGRSVNTYFIPLEERAGAQNAVDVAKRLGIKFRAKGTPSNPRDAEFAADPQSASQWGAFTLGVSATTPLDVANAYATLAADGKYCEPLPVIEIQDLHGNKLDAANPRCRQVVDRNVARAAVDAARCPLGDQSALGHKCDGATEKRGRGIVGKPIAGKTGTTDGDMTASLMAMTKQLAIMGTLADPDSPNNPPSKMDHEPVNTAVLKTLHDATAKDPAIDFTAPISRLAYGKKVHIPDVTCASVDRATSVLKSAGFGVQKASAPVDSTCPAGSVARTDPSGSTSAGSDVVIYISSGSSGKPKPGQGPGGGIPPPTCVPPLCPPRRG